MFFNSNIKSDDIFCIEITNSGTRLPDSVPDLELTRLLNIVCPKGKIIQCERFVKWEALLVQICYPALYHHPPCPKKSYVLTADRDLACDVMGHPRDTPEEKAEIARKKEEQEKNKTVK